MNGPDNNQGKPPLSILPDVLEDVARVMELGASKHGRHNWIEQDYELTQFYDAAQRHLLAWLRGVNLDNESGEPHLAHALANLMMLHQLDNENRGKDDRRKEPAQFWLGVDVAGEGNFTWYGPDGVAHSFEHSVTPEPGIVWGPATIVELPSWWRPWRRWRWFR